MVCTKFYENDLNAWDGQCKNTQEEFASYKTNITEGVINHEKMVCNVINYFLVYRICMRWCEKRRKQRN